MHKVHELNPVIYPTRVWVVFMPDVRKLDRQFYAVAEDGTTLSEFPADAFDDDFTVAQTMQVRERLTGERGCLIGVTRPKDLSSGIIGHEASHCADWLTDNLGVGIRPEGCAWDTGEAIAYYQQWIIDQVELLRDRYLKKKHK